jgi:hypothetical protein
MKLSKICMIFGLLTTITTLILSIVMIADSPNTRAINNNLIFNSKYITNPDLGFQHNNSKGEIWQIPGHMDINDFVIRSNLSDKFPLNSCFI